MIIDRYIVREISKPAFSICTVLIGIFGCYTAARFLEEAVQGQLPGSTVILMVLLRTTIALEVLLPTTLYLSVMITFGRLYMNSEITGLFACGVRMVRVLKPVVFMALAVALVVACFSLCIRPWAWNQIYALEAKAESNFSIAQMKAGNFFEIEGGNKVIFADQVDQRANRAQDVFMQIKSHGETQIVHAKVIDQTPWDADRKSFLVFQKGHLYEFPDNEKACNIFKFDKLTMPWSSKTPIPLEQKVKSFSTRQLMHSNSPEETAELQWRFTAPFSTILLALLGVSLSRTSPRQGEYAKVPLGILVFAIYYNINAITKKWIGQGIVSAIPGTWWTQLILALFLLVHFLGPSLMPRRHKR